jgi:integrase
VCAQNFAVLLLVEPRTFNVQQLQARDVYGTGLRAGKVLRLKVKHIDSAQMITHVEQWKGRKLVMLSPETHILLRAWCKVRPRHYDEGVPMSEAVRLATSTARQESNLTC